MNPSRSGDPFHETWPRSGPSPFPAPEPEPTPHVPRATAARPCCAEGSYPGARPTLVFDLDGTLSDPFDGIWRSANHALAQLGHEAVPRECFRSFIGPPLDQSFRSLVPEADGPHVDSLVAAYRERYGRVGFAENTLYPGIPEMLQTLHDMGFRCGICTSKRRDFALQVLELFELTARFAFVSGGDVGVRKSDQLRQLLTGGEIDAGAIMIGDRASDLEGAAANGLRAVAVTWGFGTLAELEAASPWAVCHGCAELPDVLMAALPTRTRSP